MWSIKVAVVSQNLVGRVMQGTKFAWMKLFTYFDVESSFTFSRLIFMSPATMDQALSLMLEKICSKELRK